jgi:uncharacterized OB-fold protein
MTHFAAETGLQLANVLDNKDLLPIVPYIGVNSRGEPELLGQRCTACGEIFLGRPKVCARCGARDAMKITQLANTGKLYVWTTVSRSLPGVPTPFVFAIVDLDGGGVVKGTLIAPELELRYDLPVTIVFEKADASDAKGRSYLTYHFVMSRGSEHG